MRLADRGLNEQALSLEEAQTKIRLLIRDGYLSGRPQGQINEQVQKVIRAALHSLRTPTLREAAYRSLNNFAAMQYRTYLLRFGTNTALLAALLVLNDTERSERVKSRAEQYIRASPVLRLETDAKGIPLQVYAKEYFHKAVEPVFEELLRQKALDPDDVSGSNSLRNRAEMEVRYADHLAQIADLKARGVRLVVCSVHADCSDRCYPWQGRVYSLDGSSGVTDDGKPYVPLEKATDIFYTTKAGKVYKNGLLGFNCRHSLMPYKAGMVIPFVSKETQQRESAINSVQRKLELTVREWKERALIYRGISREKYTEAKAKAQEWRSRYISFSRANGRAYYPDRIQLL